MKNDESINELNDNFDTIPHKRVSISVGSLILGVIAILVIFVGIVVVKNIFKSNIKTDKNLIESSQNESVEIIQ